MGQTNTYTQLKNNILGRKGYKILSFKGNSLELFYYSPNTKRITLNGSYTESELNALVSELNQQEIICECEDLSNIEENC